MSLQQTVGWLESRPLMMWNPPWALAPILPFGLPGYSAGRVGWLMLHFGLVLFCVDVSWRLYGLPTKRRWVAWVLGFTFIPTLWVLHLGQISPLMLLGVIGFLYFEQRHTDWPAGFSLSLVLIKPQLLYLFVIASIIWALSRRRWFIILGMASALAIQVATVLAVDPGVFTQYFASVRLSVALHLAHADHRHGAPAHVRLGPDLATILTASGRHSLAFVLLAQKGTRLAMAGADADPACWRRWRQQPMDGCTTRCSCCRPSYRSSVD